jgi:hypothetical protein
LYPKRFSKFVFLLLLILFLIIPASAITWTAYGDAWKGTDGAYYVIMWNQTGSHSWLTTGNTTEVEYLVVAGGGGGGGYGGGGGAGGLLEGTALAVSGIETINVGVGGTGGNIVGYLQGGDGGSSTLTNDGATIATTGGGGGGAQDAGKQSGRSGGSGGGGRGIGGTGGAGTAGQGNDGGAGRDGDTYSGGGGGGKGHVGYVGGVAIAGNGGEGYASDIIESGIDLYYAGGGGGGRPDAGTVATGGSGIGGNGGAGATAATAGVINTGSGGGGGGSVSGFGGGSGVVIIRYSTSTPTPTPTPTGTAAAYTSNELYSVLNSCNGITWALMVPSERNFNGTTIYRNGTFLYNVTNATAVENWYNLGEGLGYEISTCPFYLNGTSNTTWTNSSSHTALCHCWYCSVIASGEPTIPNLPAVPGKWWLPVWVMENAWWLILLIGAILILKRK